MNEWWKGRDRTSVLPKGKPAPLPDWAEEREALLEENKALLKLVQRYEQSMTEALAALREAKGLLSRGW